MKNEKLKIVRRIGMPETNSSSSHAVSISTSPDNLVSPGDKDWDIEITEDGVLRIPGGRDFGWEYFKTNSILVKLQYLCGIYCYDIRSDSGKKKITRLKKILKQIFGVKDVEFLWITDFSNRLKEKCDPPEEVYYCYPEIDHNSHDIFEEITENINVIRSFLLSRDSWLFGGNDNSDAPAGFYSKSICNKHVSAIISIELGGEIGRVDWEIENLFDKIGSDAIKNTITKEDSFDILNEIFYDQKEKTWIIPSANQQNENFLKDLIKPDGLLFSIFRSPIIYKNSKLYILFTRCKFNDVWIEIKKGKGKDYYEYDQITKEAIDSCKEGEDYILFPVKIKLLDYGNYEI